MNKKVCEERLRHWYVIAFSNLNIIINIHDSLWSVICLSLPSGIFTFFVYSKLVTILYLTYSIFVSFLLALDCLYHIVSNKCLTLSYFDSSVY